MIFPEEKLHYLQGGVMDIAAENIKIHDKYQIELKFTYPVDPAKKVNEYHVDTYIFLPKNLFINSHTYSRDHFYRDMQRYIRLKTPAVLLSKLISSGADSPYAKLADSLKALGENPGERKALFAACEEHLKMFCSIMKSALRDEELFLEKFFFKEDLPFLTEKYFSSVTSILEKFRSLSQFLETPAVTDQERQLFALADEFLSLTVTRYYGKLWAFLEGKKANGRDFSGILSKTATLCREEEDYRKSMAYPSLLSPANDNEELLYREGVLKKAMASILFLQTSTRRDGVILENILFGAAAGIAMTFATAVAYLYQSLFVQEFTMTFFILVVAAYMLKDRIKEWFRAFFYSGLHKFIFDYHTRITSTLGRELGSCKEGMRFVSESSLEENIVRIRAKNYMTDMENERLGEDIIFSRKHIHLTTRNCERIFNDFQVDGIVDIMRFNIRRFLERMDNPTKELYLPSAKEPGTLEKVKAKRVYHVNIIIRYGMDGQKDTYRRLRLVLTRNGIRRIEDLSGN